LKYGSLRTSAVQSCNVSSGVRSVGGLQSVSLHAVASLSDRYIKERRRMRWRGVGVSAIIRPGVLSRLPLPAQVMRWRRVSVCAINPGVFPGYDIITGTF
jgi:hypothetical protein